MGMIWDLTGLGHLNTILNAPFVRETQVTFGTSPDTTFDFTYCQLDEQMALATQVVSANQDSGALTTDFLYANVTHQFSTMHNNDPVS